MTLIDFIQEFNNSLPSTAELKTKFGKDFDAASFVDNYKLNCSPQDEKVNIETMSTLLEKTNIIEAPTSGFTFHIEPRIKTNLLADFAMFNDFYYFASNSTGQIVSSTNLLEDVEIVSPSIELFLQVLLTYNKYNTQVVYHNHYDLTPFANKLDYYKANGFSKSWLRDFFMNDTNN